MIDLDDILQKSLADLERGVPIETVLAELPPEASSLAPLIKLAAKSRLLAHPQMSPTAARLQQARLIAATTRTKLSRWFNAIPTLPTLFRGDKLVYAMGFAAVLFVFVLIGVSLINLGQVSAHTANLVSPSGLVEVASASGDESHFIQEGESLKQGQSVRTYADSSVLLVFSDGSRTTIGPDSDVILTDFGDSKDASIQVKLTQNSGSTTNDVIPLHGSGSYFLVDTPNGVATVHGTSFDVSITAAGQTLFGVTHGLVQVKNSYNEVLLASGQATLVEADEDPEKPGYQFTLQGKIDAIDETTHIWTVNGVQVDASAAEILGTFAAGDDALVRGRILDTGVWVADSIQPPNNDKTRLRFTGVVDTKGPVPGTWVIGGQDIYVDGQTDLEGDIQEKSPVEVNFVVMEDGKWRATSIELLEDEEPVVPPTETNTPTVTNTPGEASPTSTVTATPTVTGTPGEATATVEPKNDTQRCENRTEQHPAALKLVQKFNGLFAAKATNGAAVTQVTYEEIMEWFCKGFGFGEIDLAYDLSLKSGLPVANIFQMRIDGMGWGNIKKEVTKLMSTGTPMAPKNKGKGPKK